jgi:hypothetical protein
MYNISYSWVDVLIFTSRVTGLTQFHGGSDKGTESNFVQLSEKWDGDPGMIRQAFR